MAPGEHLGKMGGGLYSAAGGFSLTPSGRAGCCRRLWGRDGAVQSEDSLIDYTYAVDAGHVAYVADGKTNCSGGQGAADGGRATEDARAEYFF